LQINLHARVTQRGFRKIIIENIHIEDFFDKLPQETFTLAEWAGFCVDNPQYLTVNQPSVNMITMATNKGIRNVTDLTDPLTILK
jgi:hypothetical protein